jgi:hypothetical protein
MLYSVSLLCVFCFNVAGCAQVSQQRQALQYSFTVAADGFGDFTTVQAAINAVPDYSKNPPRSS